MFKCVHYDETYSSIKSIPAPCTIRSPRKSLKGGK